MFLGWGLFHQKRERNQTSGMKPMQHSMDIGDFHSVIRRKDENLPMQVSIPSVEWNSSSYFFLIKVNKSDRMD